MNCKETAFTLIFGNYYRNLYIEIIIIIVYDMYKF